MALTDEAPSGARHDPMDDPLSAAPHTPLDLTRQLSLPLELGTLELLANGRIRPHRKPQRLVFRFTYRGLPFAGELPPDAEAPLRLEGEFGKLPYTAETAVGRRLLRRMAAATTALPRGQLVITEAQDLRLVAAAPVPSPRTPAAVIATITVLLLDFRSLLDFAEDLLGSTDRLLRAPALQSATASADPASDSSQ